MSELSGVVVAVLGLGEAGSLIAGGPVRAGEIVRGYDPRVNEAGRVVSLSSAVQACRGACGARSGPISIQPRPT